MDEKIREQIYSESRNFQRRLENLETKKLTKNNKQAILSFLKYCQAKGISKHQQMKYIDKLGKVGELLGKDFKKAEKEDMIGAFAKLQEGYIAKNGEQKKYSGWSMNTFQTCVKAFYRQLFDLEKGDPLPKSVRWIDVTKPPQRLQAQDLFTTEELERLLRQTTDIQWKALLVVLSYGLRPSEALSLQLKNCFVHEDHIALRIGGKTEKRLGKRDAYIFSGYMDVKKWIENHHYRQDKNMPLFITRNGKPKAISSGYLNQLIKRLSHHAGISKNSYAYLLRHGFATRITEQYGINVASKSLGHTNLLTTQRYEHTSQDKLKEILSGKKKKQVVEDQFCERCASRRNYNEQRCSKCGLAFTEEGIKPLLDENRVRELILELAPQLADLKLKKPKN